MVAGATTATREVDELPSLGRLYAKAAGRMLLPGGAGDGELPDTELVLRGLLVDRAALAAYNRVCGFAVSEQVPATYLHVLTFPLAVELMTGPDFPFALPGLVHIGNRLRQHRPVRASEPLELRVRLADLRPHPKGRQFDMIMQVRAGGEVVWEEASTNLRRGGGDDTAEAGPDLPDPGRLPFSAQWRIPADTGRRYAAVSGDRNPIHLHPLTAKAFGFPRQIVHGMWTAARVLAALEGRTSDAYTYDVAFKTPIVLPATVEFASEPDGGTWRLGVRDRSGKPHLAGRLDPVE